VSDRRLQFAAEITKELNKSGIRTIPEVLCRPQTKGLARVVGVSRVCDQ